MVLKLCKTFHGRWTFDPIWAEIGYPKFLWDPPPLIPSGHRDHGNTPIGEGETHLSIAAGDLFRWVAYDFCSAKSLLKTYALKKQINKDAGVLECWREGLAMFSTLRGREWHGCGYRARRVRVTIALPVSFKTSSRT